MMKIEDHRWRDMMLQMIPLVLCVLVLLVGLFEHVEFFQFVLGAFSMLAVLSLVIYWRRPRRRKRSENGKWGQVQFRCREIPHGVEQRRHSIRTSLKHEWHESYITTHV